MNCTKCGEPILGGQLDCNSTAIQHIVCPSGAGAALEGRKLDANQYLEESDLHFEWLAGWTNAKMEMRKAQPGCANGSVILTVAEIRQLAGFAGLIVAPPSGKFDGDENEEEITVEDCPKRGVFDEESGKYHHFKRIAYFSEYPEEGVYPIGPEISPNATETRKPGSLK